MSKLLQTIGTSYARSFIITLISIGIVLPLMCVCVLVPLGIATRSGGDTQTTLWIMVVPAACFLLLIIGGGWGYLIFVLVRRARRLDSTFEPLGLTGRMYALTGRQYHGTVKGREVKAFIYRGPALDMRVSTRLQKRVTIANADAVSVSLARTFGRDPLDVSDPGLSGLVIFAQDEAWARSLLANSEVKALLRKLILGDNLFVIRRVHLKPGTLSLYLYRSNQLFRFELAPEEVVQWFNGLLALARIAESQPDM